MDQVRAFIHWQNIELFRRLLDEEKDESRRRVLLALLRDEEAKCALPGSKVTQVAASNDG